MVKKEGLPIVYDVYPENQLMVIQLDQQVNWVN